MFVALSRHPLASIKKLLVYYRLMFALIYKSAPAHFAVIKMIFQNLCKLAFKDSLAMPPSETFLMNMVHYGSYRIISGGIHFECLSNEGSVYGIDDYRAFFRILRLANI